MKFIEFGPEMGFSRADQENWMKRLELRSEYAKTVAGSARSFSRENVLELSIIAAFVNVGASPATGAAFAAMVLRHVANDELREWIIFPRAEMGKSTGTDTLTNDAVEAIALAGTPMGASVVPVGAIKRKVYEMFDDLAGRG